ncbi:hypothetical protein ES703_00779 [subsurface metagenome]
MVKKYLLSKADAGEIERQLDNILGMVGKYCQPELGRAVRKIRKIVKDREMNVH